MNQVTIDSKNLTSLLRRLAPAIEPNPIIPILESVLFEVNLNLVKVIATNLNLFIAEQMECTSETVFSVALPFSQLLNISSTLRGPMHIESHELNVIIRSESDEFKLGKPVDAVHFPLLPKFETSDKISVESDFFNSLEIASRSTFQNDSETIFNNVCLDIDNNELHVVSSDRMKLFYQCFVVDHKKKYHSLLSIDFIKAVKSMPSGDLYLGEKYICAESGQLQVLTQVNEQAYANYRVMLNGKDKTNCTIEKLALENALSKLLVYRGVDKKSVYYPAELSFSENEMKVRHHNVDYEKEVHTVIHADHKLSDTIIVDTNKLQSLLNSIPSDCNNIFLSISGFNKPVYIEPDTDDKITLLIMPIVNS